MADALAAHAAKRESLRESLRQGAGPVALAKETSNLFRDRELGSRRRLDVRGFNQVLRISDGWVEAEGMIPYDDLTRECLARGVMPAVVPQLKTITLGGAVAGVWGMLFAIPVAACLKILFNETVRPRLERWAVEH